MMEDSGIETTDEALKKNHLSSGEVTKSSRLLDSDSELSDEDIGSLPNEGHTLKISNDDDNFHPKDMEHSLANKYTSESSRSMLTADRQSSNYATSHSIINSTNKGSNTRHDITDRQPGVQGQMETSGLLVDVQINDSDSEDEIPLSWQRSGRRIKDQLLRDGYNLDLESDNDELDLIPPKQSNGSGGICSCSSESCVIT